ncbi:MAG: GGDEF domain-containing protein [Peptostreptococcus sp.]|uniref:GGDEF domain-containing protein n=1 Tax=Peptostreptococcus sp. TaxID=1262 RepID=UPI002FC849F9
MKNRKTDIFYNENSVKRNLIQLNFEVKNSLLRINNSDKYNLLDLHLDSENTKEKCSFSKNIIETMFSIIEDNNCCIMLLNKEGELIFYDDRASIIDDYEDFAYFLKRKVSFSEECHQDKSSGKARYYDSRTDKYYEISCYFMKLQEDFIVYNICDVSNHERQRKKLLKYSFTDSMTGIYNRRFCIDKIKENLLDKKKFTLIFLDLDILKSINDEFGHLAGDLYIVETVNTIKKYIGENDYFCRYGGDEFILLLEESLYTEIDKKMEEINYEIKLKDEARGAEFFNVSYGVVYIDENNIKSFEDIIIEGDKKMYEYKKKYRKKLDK